MNPVAVLLILVAVLFLVIGFRGHQDNVIAALLGRQWKGSTLT